ncbi:MAG: hypothetical protein ACK4EY_14450 [Flavipsychrobacter sp.]
MKKYLGVTLALAIGSLATYAQPLKTKKPKKEGYMRIGIGYNTPTAAQRMAHNTPLNGTLIYNNNGLADYELKKASFTAGMQANLAIGIMLNKNIGFELNNVVGLLPVKYQAGVEYPDNGYTIRELYAKRATGTFFTVPSLVMQYGNKLQFYTRIGAVLPVISRIENSFAYSATFNNTTQQIKGVEKLKHNFNAGISTAVGIKGQITKGLNGWVEMNYTSLTLNVKRAELTEYFVNGQNLLPRVTNPTQQYTPSSANANTTLPSIVHPYSSLGLHLGISFTF